MYLIVTIQRRLQSEIDYFNNLMEYFTTHLRPLPRRMPATLRVSALGYIPHKTNSVNFVFPSVNFSFILSGSGTYRHEGNVIAVTAPAVLMQWPGLEQHYGPRPEGAPWEELFIIYEADAATHLAHWGITPATHHAWPLQESAAVREQIERLFELVTQLQVTGTADRIDRVCERLILESQISTLNPSEPPSVAAVRLIHRTLMGQLGKNHDLDALARAHGLSSMTFRRYWARLYGTPPHRTLLSARLREACRYLAETTWPVGEISGKLGFQDPLYFSRRFHKAIGMPPTAYREKYKHPE